MLGFRRFSKIHENYELLVVNLCSKKDAPEYQQIPGAKTGALACPLLLFSLHVPGTVISTASPAVVVPATSVPPSAPLSTKVVTPLSPTSDLVQLMDRTRVLAS